VEILADAYSETGEVTGSHRGRGRPPQPRLTVEQILAWADAHHAATGLWPKQHTGPIPQAPGETWSKVAGALSSGSRGFPGGTTLKRFLMEHRGSQVEARIPRLSLAGILCWADAYLETHGVWPTAQSGPIDQVPGLTWNTVDLLLRRGGHGLLGGSSLGRLLADERRLSLPRPRSPLSVDRILTWADRHHARHGTWPTVKSGPVSNATGEWWWLIDAALREGGRGLPGGSSLHRLLAEHRLAPRRPLTLELVLEWAEAHRAATGSWPSATSGPVAAAPGETWSTINAALGKGCRGLPAGTSLAKLFAGREAGGEATVVVASDEPADINAIARSPV
jgi:hypothetical protein